MFEDTWAKYDLMSRYIHTQCVNEGWLKSHEAVDPSVVGIMLKLGQDELARVPTALNQQVMTIFEQLPASAAITMSSDLTASLFRQISPHQTEIVIQPYAIKVPIVDSLESMRRTIVPLQVRQSACVVRQEKIIFIWSDTVEKLMPHGAELERVFRDMLWSTPASDFHTFKRANLPRVHSVQESLASSRYAYATSEEYSEKIKSGFEYKIEQIYDPEGGSVGKKARPMILTHSIIVGLSMMLIAFVQIGQLAVLLSEVAVDGQYKRMAYLLMVPVTSVFALFFAITLVGCLFQIFHPVRDIEQNSRFYSAIAPKLAHHAHVEWPHITIQIPVYKEGLNGVIIPTISSVKRAVKHYENLGGTATVYMNEDGMQVVSEEVADARRRFYKENGIAYCARPPHGQDGYLRKGQFKKASNMNYCLDFSSRVEDELLRLITEYEQGFEKDISIEKENELYELAMATIIEGDGGKTWADGNVRLGELILLLDCDTKVPVDCLYLGALEMIESPDMAIIQHASGVMQVAHNFFENGMTYLTNLIYNAIQFGVGSGDLACFVGHNAFLRWKAVQSVAFAEDDTIKYWSDAHVSEDFDLALRLQIARFTIRLGAYHTGDNAFKEGVSLTVFDELARWQKYAYGCNELLFNPLHKWFYKGPFTSLFTKFIFSNVKTSSKTTILGYVFTYYAMASALPLALINYVVMGLIPEQLDKAYLASFQVMFVLLLVFNLLAPIAYNVMLYRLGKMNFFRGMWLSIRWMPLFIIFFGGVSLHLLKSILCHFFSIKMEWNSTAKELTETGFFIGMDKIWKDYKYMYAIVILLTAGVVYMAVWAPAGYLIIAPTFIVPLANQLACHFLLPIALGLF